MTSQSTEHLFQKAAEAEGGISISAGARIAHVRLALDSGRAVTVDLSHVPEDLRSPLIELIRDMVKIASDRSGSEKADIKPAVDSTQAARPNTLSPPA